MDSLAAPPRVAGTSPVMTLAQKQAALAADLAAFPNVQQRLAWLVEQARRRPLLPAELRTAAHRVPGCLSRLWFVPEFRDGRCHFRAESDSLIVKSIAGLLCEFYSGHAPEEILAHDPGFLGEFGISQARHPEPPQRPRPRLGKHPRLRPKPRARRRLPARHARRPSAHSTGA